MTRRLPCVMGAIALCLAAFPALAHHGQDFLLVESPTVPHPGDAYLLANVGVALDDRAEEQAGFEPALLVGLAPRFAFELHAHTEKAADDAWRYDATAPSLHVLLTDPQHDGLKVGLSAEYEIARAGDADALEARLSLEQADAHRKTGANLVYRHERGGTGHFGAVLGVHWHVAPRVAVGAEGMSDFDRAEGAEVIASAHWECDEAWSLKFGLGGQRAEDGRWMSLARFGVVLRLRD